MAHEIMHVIQYIEEASFATGDGRFDTESEAYLMQKMMLWLQDAYAMSGRKFWDPSAGDTEATRADATGVIA